MDLFRQEDGLEGDAHFEGSRSHGMFPRKGEAGDKGQQWEEEFHSLYRWCWGR